MNMIVQKWKLKSIVDLFVTFSGVWYLDEAVVRSR